jgi:hypothetical protein
MKQLAVDALKHRYEGQKKSAEYVIKNYFSHPAAIGEHPDLIKYIGWGLLYCGKPFTAIGNWFWKKHRAVLDRNE